MALRCPSFNTYIFVLLIYFLSASLNSQTPKDVIEVDCGTRYSIARTATCIFGWGRLCPEIDMGSTPMVVYKGATQKIAAGSWHWALIDGSSNLSNMFCSGTPKSLKASDLPLSE